MLTAADIANVIEAQVEDALADCVAAALRPFDGKPINKRLATAVARTLPAYTIYYESGTMYAIVIWGDGIVYDRRRRFLLGYASHSNTFDYQRFVDDYSRCWFGAAAERNASRAQKLADAAWLHEVAETINTLQAAKKRLEELLDSYPDKYPIEKLVERAW